METKFQIGDIVQIKGMQSFGEIVNIYEWGTDDFFYDVTFDKKLTFCYHEKDLTFVFKPTHPTLSSVVPEASELHPAGESKCKKKESKKYLSIGDRTRFECEGEITEMAFNGLLAEFKYTTEIKNQ